MTYRITYNEQAPPRGRAHWRLGSQWAEEYSTEHQALGRARELLESGTHDGIAVCDHDGNVLYGVRLQLRLGANSRD